MRRPARAAAALSLSFALALPAAGLASGPSVRRASSAERRAIVAYYVKEDGGSSRGVYGVYVSRTNSSLAVLCARTPEAGNEAFVVRRSHGGWRYETSGKPGRAGSSSDRQLERAC